MTAARRAWHFDGETALKRAVDIQIVGKTFSLSGIEDRTGPYAVSDLKYIGQQGQSTVYGLNDRDGWRLGFDGEIPGDVAAILPPKITYGGFIDRFGLLPSAALLTAISAACIAVAYFTPQWLAPFIPASVERNIGTAMVGNLNKSFCHTLKGDAALTKLAQALDNNAGTLKINVAKIDMVNAIALPGNNIVLFNGLVGDAKSPDAVAGVLAHEMGHVRERHVMQAMLQQLGMAVVLMGTDSNAGGMLSNVLSLNYGRKAERDADKYSMRALARASISPIPTAEFFAKMAIEDGTDKKDISSNKIASYLASHPISAERQRNFENSVIKGQAFKLSLSPDEWFELKTMCAQDKKAKQDIGFGL